MNGYGFSSLSKTQCRTKHNLSPSVLLKDCHSASGDNIFFMVLYLVSIILTHLFLNCKDFFGQKFSDTSIRSLTFYHDSCVRLFSPYPIHLSNYWQQPTLPLCFFSFPFTNSASLFILICILI